MISGQSLLFGAIYPIRGKKEEIAYHVDLVKQQGIEARSHSEFMGIPLFNIGFVATEGDVAAFDQQAALKDQQIETGKTGMKQQFLDKVALAIKDLPKIPMVLEMELGRLSKELYQSLGKIETPDWKAFTQQHMPTDYPAVKWAGLLSHNLMQGTFDPRTGVVGQQFQEIPNDQFPPVPDSYYDPNEPRCF